MADPQPGWQTADAQPLAAHAFHIERVIDPFTRSPTIGMVRHAAQPFVLPAPARQDPTDADWFALAADYLRALRQALSADAAVDGWPDDAVWTLLVGAGAAAAAGGCGFGWLPITWGKPLPATGGLRDAEPIGSFWVPRRADDTVPVASTLVLLAGRVAYGQTDADGGGPRKALLLASDSGVRISLQVDCGGVRILGVTFSGLASARALAPFPAGLHHSAAAVFTLVEALRAPIKAALGKGRMPWLRVLEPVPGNPARLRAAGHALRPQRPPASAGDELQLNRAAIYDFSVELDLTDPAKPRVLQVLRNEFAGSAVDKPPARRRQLAAAAGARDAGAAESRAPAGAALDYRPAQVFLQDAASRAGIDSQTGALQLVAVRPSRDEAQLDAARQPIDLLLDADGRLAYSLGGDPMATQRLFETRAGRRSEGAVLDAAGTPVDEGAVVLASSVGAAAGASLAGPLWTDVQAALQAHQRAGELFSRLAAYGIDPLGHFRFARLPLVQRARGSTRWAPEADLPYAEVRPFLGDDVADAATSSPSPMARPQLLVKYGSADPMQRRMVAVGPVDKRGSQRRVAQYLGVASDPRWAWHEFGHVLNYAATGELEFPFAHSAGDALGAIIADPLSVLALDNHSPLRFASFPWIEVPGRSHGRSVYEGYCWCGRRNLVRLAADAPLERHHHGYFEEQILSSSLFRLYRCLGGDTRGCEGLVTDADADTDTNTDADALERLAASDFTVALIMRAISLLGHDGVAPARTADQFVTALIDADAGLGARQGDQHGDWQIEADWPLDRDPRTVRRQGGLAHKAIRWSFEQQGLDAADDCTAIVDGPGRPPVVDLFIADRRPALYPGAGAGGYAPVALRHGALSAAWHADAEALAPAPGGVRVQVRNRGRGPQPAVGLRLRAWWAPARAEGAVLIWSDPIQWGERAAQLAPGAEVVVTLVHPSALAADAGWSKAADGWLLVAVDTPADPSNLAPGATPPVDLATLMHLVAQDNNLALRRFSPPAALVAA